MTTQAPTASNVAPVVHQSGDPTAPLAAEIRRRLALPAPEVTRTDEPRAPPLVTIADAPAAYRAAFARIRDYLLAGDCYQVNLARHFVARGRTDAWALYSQLHRLQPGCFSAYLGMPRGAVLSFSPERLLRVRDRIATSQPIKGTARRSDNPHRDEAARQERRPERSQPAPGRGAPRRARS